MQAAEALHGLLKGGDTIEHYCKIIFEREAEADEITRQVLTAVRRTFITPFDRTDIQDLVNALDDSIDQMNKTAKTITLFEVKSFQPQMQRDGRDHRRGGEARAGGRCRCSPISASNADKLNELTEKIIRIEERADQLYDKGRKALLPRECKGRRAIAMNFIIQADLYDHLEKVVDRFEDVSNEINALVTDHL